MLRSSHGLPSQYFTLRRTSLLLGRLAKLGRTYTPKNGVHRSRVRAGKRLQHATSVLRRLQLFETQRTSVSKGQHPRRTLVQIVGPAVKQTCTAPTE